MKEALISALSIDRSPVAQALTGGWRKEQKPGNLLIMKMKHFWLVRSKVRFAFVDYTRVAQLQIVSCLMCSLLSAQFLFFSENI